ncbi:MAG: TonB-dependent receptor [Porticoccus sp.]|nr:TonB-dependent receptor [Porticoccus sp.]
MNASVKSSLLTAMLLISPSGFSADNSFAADVIAPALIVPETAATESATTKPVILEEVIVTAEFRDVSVLDTGNSISVISSDTIDRREARHLEQVLNLVPNVNYSSGASRGRFIQIRGIGERSQFIEPVNPSVGLLVDGIDFSGIGGAATTLDVQQIEIFRGPQGTLFGANALAGLIDMKSNDPSEHFEGSLETSFAEYDTRTVSGVISGPVTDNLGYRLAVQQHKSDGYVENDFLNRDDTNNIDEQTVRGKLHWQVNDELEMNFTGFYVNADNGYDSFTLDNTRHTLSDQPGYDRQESTAFSVESTWKGIEQFDVISQISYAESNLEYGFDEDWTFTDICSGEPCDGWAWTSFDNYLRDRETKTVDLRLVSSEQGLLFNDSTDWVMGIYYRDQEESLLRKNTGNPDFISDFDTKNYAVYGQLGSQLSDNLRLTTGLRLEYRNADYWDNDGVNNDKGERLWGGRLGLEYQVTDNAMIYGLVARGYKAGGVNSDTSLAESSRAFGTEYMWNFETGIKSDWLEGTLQAQLALFYQKRRKMQVKQSLVEPISGNDCPCSFTDFIDNAEKGANYGAELEFTWLASDVVQFYGSLGLLRATFKDFESFSHVDADPANGIAKDLSGHEQAHSPSYQFALGVELALTHNLTAGLELEGKESFYLSPRHNAKTNRYELINTRLNYRLADWEVSLWGRNLADRDVIVRGFGSFNNDPRDFYTGIEPYYQYGEPRIFGASAKYHF